MNGAVGAAWSPPERPREPWSKEELDRRLVVVEARLSLIEEVMADLVEVLKTSGWPCRA